jgi:phospholipid N-methyltransferase
MLSKIDFEDVKTIVEYGPGTGVFTKEILSRMSDDAQLFVFELNEQMYELLIHKINDSRCTLINRSAGDLSEILAENSISEVDCIVSSLPFTTINNEISKHILKSSQKALRSGGDFIQFMYFRKFKVTLAKYFEQVTIQRIFLNFPPAYVFICKKAT